MTYTIKQVSNGYILTVPAHVHPVSGVMRVSQDIVFTNRDDLSKWLLATLPR